MNRDGIAIQAGREVDFPEADAVSLCKNGLAEPVGWEMSADDAAADAEDETPRKPSKKKQAAE